MKTMLKKNIGKKLSRFLSVGISALLLVTAVPSVGYAAIPTDNVLISATNFTVNAAMDVSWPVNKAIDVSSDNRIMVEFDFTASSNDFAYKIMSRDKNVRDFAHLILAPNGKVVIGINGGSPYALSKDPAITPLRGFNAADYEANKTYRMTMVYDINGRNAEEGHDTTIDYYMDGKYLYTADTSFFGSTGESPSTKADTYLANIFFGSCSLSCASGVKVDATGKSLKIENFKVINADQYKNLEYDTPVVDEEGVKIKFSETLACANTADYTSGNDLSGIKIKSIDGKEVEGVSASIKNETLSVTYTGSLASDKTYYVVLPKNFKSADEKVLADNAIAFKAPASSVQGLEATVYSEDFEKATNGNAPAGLGYSDVDKTFEQVDDIHKNAWRLKNDYSDVKYVRCKAVDDNSLDLSDEIVVSADFYLNTIKRTADIMVQKESGNKKFGFCFFDSDGHFVVVKDKNHAWSNDETVTSSNNTYIVANTLISAKKWYTVKMVINKSDRTVTYYLGNDDNWENVATVPILQGTEEDRFDEFRLQGWANSSQKRPYGDFYMDNIKIGYQNINTTMKNVLATDTNNINYDFTEVEAKLGDKYLLDADVKFTQANKRLYFRTTDTKHNLSGLIFSVDESGNLTMSKSLLNWLAADYMVSLNTKVNLNENTNIKLLVDKTKVKTVLVFVNNKYVRSLALGWGNEPSNANYLTDNMGAADFIKGDNNSDPNTIEKVSIGHVTSNIPENIILTDSSNKTYGIYTNGIPADIGSVMIGYSETFADGTDVNGAKIKAKGDDGTLTEVDGYTAALSDDKKSIVISKEDGVLTNGTYVISVSGINGADDFSTEFIVNDTRSLVINSFSIAKDGSEYYPSISAKNYSEVKAEFVVLVCEYTKDAVPQLINVKVKPIELTGGASLTTDKSVSELVLTTSRTDTEIKAFVWNKFGENIPLVNAQTYSE